MEHILYFNKPARDWEEAFPIGNGRLGAMIFSGTKDLRLQMNEISLWNGQAYPDADKKGAYKHLPELRNLIYEKRYSDAAKLLEPFPVGLVDVEDLNKTGAWLNYIGKPDKYSKPFDKEIIIGLESYFKYQKK